MIGGLQTIHVESVTEAQKLAMRLCRAGYYFICRNTLRPSIGMSRFGRHFTFSDAIDFERDAKLFAGISYWLIGTEKPDK